MPSSRASFSAPPPPTPVDDLVETLHGVAVPDPARWLEDEHAPAVQEWMAAQDAFTRAQLRSLPGREALSKRFTELYALDAVGTPIKRNGRYFYGRRRKDQEKSMVVWRDGPTGEERVLLDPNSWSKDNTVSLGVWVPSWDGKKVAFTEKPNAADEATLYVLDVDSGQRSPVDVIEGAKYASPSWSADSKGFLYTFLPNDPAVSVADRPGTAEVRMHVLGEDPKRDRVVHPKTGNPRTFIGGGYTKSGRFVLVTISHGWNANDVWFKPADAPDAPFTLLVKGEAVEATYEVDEYQGRFYVMTNEGAPNQRLFVVDPARPGRAHWRELIAEDPTSARSSFALVGGLIAVDSLRAASSHVELFSPDDGRKVRDVALPGLGTSSNLLGLDDDDEAYFSYSSFVDPPQIFKTSVRTGAVTQWAKIDVPVDPRPFEVKQVAFASKDGTRVTMFVVAKKGLVLDGQNPTLLYGYGGFNVPITSTFRSSIYPWLEAGGVYAAVNLRGGSEYGSAWHDAGKLANKQNVFDDFIAAGEYLVAQKYTSPKRLAISGGSNGGLLVGAAMTQRTDLFGAVVCSVPLLDMVRYHRSGSGATWVPEYGDPEKAEEFKVLLAYSPYHRVVGGADYPPLLMMSSDHDDRVDPLHARKFVARLQGATNGQGVSLLRIERNAGHTGADQVSVAVEASVDQFAFLFEVLGVKSKPVVG